jgi:tRNA-dihydrouridine synthase A
MPQSMVGRFRPKQNRTIPPLQHERVVALKQRRPDLLIELNGGLETPEDCLAALHECDGAMVGRAAYAHPLRWADIDHLIYGEPPRQLLASDVVEGLIPHAALHLQRGGRLWDLCRHLVQLVEGVPVHAIGVASSANDPNAKAPISTFWKRPDVN